MDKIQLLQENDEQDVFPPQKEGVPKPTKGDPSEHPFSIPDPWEIDDSGGIIEEGGAE